jgi:hypothetical protein
MAVAALDSSRLATDSMGEADKRRRRVTGKVAAWFALAGVTWSRGEQRRGTWRLPYRSIEEKQRRESGGRLGRATWRRKGGGGGPAAQGRRWGPDGAAASSFGGGGWVVVVQHGMEMGACGPARGGRKMGPTQEHSANFHLFQIFNCLEI